MRHVSQGDGMGDKRKGKDGGNDKKPKKDAKLGRRPHEQRQGAALQKAAA